MTSVVVVTDCGSETARLTAAISALPAMEIVRYASSRTSVSRLVAAHAPDVVLIGDMTSPGARLERVREVRSAAPRAAVVVLAADAGARWLATALEAGATAVLPGEPSTKALGTVLQEVLAPDARNAAAVALVA
jgi:two-component system, NarL family, nitrate/nitrite response regulator NarL